MPHVELCEILQVTIVLQTGTYLGQEYQLPFRYEDDSLILYYASAQQICWTSNRTLQYESLRQLTGIAKKTFHYEQ